MEYVSLLALPQSVAASMVVVVAAAAVSVSVAAAARPPVLPIGRFGPLNLVCRPPRDSVEICSKLCSLDGWRPASVRDSARCEPLGGSDGDDDDHWHTRRPIKHNLALSTLASSMADSC